jgi:hypothetical protein
MNCRDKILFPDKAWVWKLLYRSHQFTYLPEQILLALWYLPMLDRKAVSLCYYMAKSLGKRLHAGCERLGFRGFRRLAAVQTAKTMQALAARTTSSYSCTARFCPKYHRLLRASDTMDPARANTWCS